MGSVLLHPHTIIGLCHSEGNVRSRAGCVCCVTVKAMCGAGCVCCVTVKAGCVCYVTVKATCGAGCVCCVTVKATCGAGCVCCVTAKAGCVCCVTVMAMCEAGCICCVTAKAMCGALIFLSLHTVIGFLCTSHLKPLPPIYRGGRGLAGLMCGAVTSWVPPQCRASDITQIYPHGIYYYKEEGYDTQQVPAVWGF